MEKIHTAVKTLRNNKTPGIDNIPVEFCKSGEQAITVTLHRIIGKIWKEETISKEWEESIICLIHKKGNKL